MNEGASYVNYLNRFGEKQMRRLLIIALGFIFVLSLVPLASAQGSGSQPYLGEIVAVGFNFPPQGWAPCSGQLLAISQNEALFSLLGTTYGGDGQVTFALPDLRGRSAVSFGQGPGLSPYYLGQPGGEEQVTLLLIQMPSHTHSVSATSSLGSVASPTGNAWAAQGRAAVFSASANTTMSATSTTLAGGSQAHENRSPFLTLNYIIALEGIYPSRN
jgi:microcystin-dependent protein